MTIILDGKKSAHLIIENIKKKTANLKEKPGLAVILANNNPASRIYVGTKEKKAKEVGFNSYVYKFDENTGNEQIIELIKKLNEDSKVQGILVQLPLFSHLSESKIIESIDPKKDVDGFHPINVGKLNLGLDFCPIPCTPKGIIRLLKDYQISLEGKNAVVIGRSNIVGKPMAALLLKESATVTIAHSKTKDLPIITKKADIIISATGIPHLIKENFVQTGAIVVDVGIIKNKEGKIIGDVDFSEVSKKASYITPTPGGVGPMTIASLLDNTLELYLRSLE